MADNTELIAELDDVIQSGTTMVVVDGQQIVTNLDVLKKERRDLLSQDATRKHDRPRVMRIDLSAGP